MNRLLSIDLMADFGMLRKPDTNEPVYLTYNMLHKPAVLGILGAIAGLSGFKKQGEVPEYLKKLGSIKIGIAPLETGSKKHHENGNFSKTIVRYNNSTGMASDEKGGNLMVTEQTLINPAYRCYILLDDTNQNHAKVIDHLKKYQAEYLPYLGKNECGAWWDNARELDYEPFTPSGPFKIDSLFIKEESLKDGTQKIWFVPGIAPPKEDSYVYFENLPTGYLEKPLFQYEYKGFALTNLFLKEQYKLPDDYPLLKLENGQVIQVF